jgi:hypothetical protein
MLWIILIGIAAVLAVAGYLFHRARPRKDGGADYFCRCPHCSRKLHYRADRGGRKARCPGCKQPFTYPVAPSEQA